MLDYVFPAVLYKDVNDNGYTISVPDLLIVTEGDTVEDAFLRARSYIENYIETVTHLDYELAKPTPFEKVQKLYKKQIVILVDAPMAT